MLCYWEIWKSLGLWLMLSRLRVICLGNMLRTIRKQWLRTMTTLSRNWVVEITRRVSKCFHLQNLHNLVFHPPRIGMTRRAEHLALCLTELFQAPTLTPPALSVVRTIRACVFQEKKDVLDVVSLVKGWGTILLHRVKEVVMVELNLHILQHQQVAQLSWVTHLVQVAVSARTDFMLFKLARIRKVLLM